MDNRPKFSIVVPAHNEQEYLPRSLDAIDRAIRVVRLASSDAGSCEVEVIVVANRCTDGTAAVAIDRGARVVDDDSRCIAAVRNAGAVVAVGEILVTIDADNLINPNALVEVERRLATGRSVGGGCSFVPERSSAGIRATVTLTRLIVGAARLGGVMFWCWLDDFRAIGGFDQDLTFAEDLDFARRLRTYGRQTGRRFENLRAVPTVISCRKFDRFGDWHMFTMIGQARSIMASKRGADTSWVDTYFHDFNV